ncbi:MAG: phosphoribosylaminoimidazolesuccinocarboxamide synthase [Pseudanabaenaceae cyanobacterium bins.68]|nr:phosphoribosylaminoimidazolesuccinocarboxamide synthase [Pseudanabaenaceae cyanobacterium bins.68]
MQNLGEQIYEGKAKILYRTLDSRVILVKYKDDATAFNAQKQGKIARKGELNCDITRHLFNFLGTQGIPHHFIRQIASDQMEVVATQIIPIEVVVRNIAAGSLSKRLGIAQGTILKRPIVEFYYKDDALGDPLINEEHIDILALATPMQVTHLKQLALEINHHLQTFMDRCELDLVDFKLEFGIDHNQEILLADEISPDTCRLWDMRETDPTAKILDKDRFRFDLGGVAESYAEVHRRILAQAF